MSKEQAKSSPSNVVSLRTHLAAAARPTISDHEAYHNAVLDQFRAKEEAIIRSFGF